MPVQAPLDLRAKDGTRYVWRLPMIGTEGIRASIGLSEDDILAEIYAGTMLWAWNLASKSSDRIFIRVWTHSIECWKAPDLIQPKTLSAVLDYVLPHHRQSLRCKELSHAFNTSSQHILNMAEAGLLVRTPGDIGPKESPLVTRSSVVALLETRRLK